MLTLLQRRNNYIACSAPRNSSVRSESTKRLLVPEKTTGPHFRVLGGVVLAGPHFRVLGGVSYSGLGLPLASTHEAITDLLHATITDLLHAITDLLHAKDGSSALLPVFLHFMIAIRKKDGAKNYRPDFFLIGAIWKGWNCVFPKEYWRRLGGETLSVIVFAEFILHARSDHGFVARDDHGFVARDHGFVARRCRWSPPRRPGRRCRWSPRYQSEGHSPDRHPDGKNGFHAGGIYRDSLTLALLNTFPRPVWLGLHQPHLACVWRGFFPTQMFDSGPGVFESRCDLGGLGLRVSKKVLATSRWREVASSGHWRNFFSALVRRITIMGFLPGGVSSLLRGLGKNPGKNDEGHHSAHHFQLLFLLFPQLARSPGPLRRSSGNPLRYAVPSHPVAGHPTASTSWGRPPTLWPCRWRPQ